MMFRFSKTLILQTLLFPCLLGAGQIAIFCVERMPWGGH